MQRWFLAPLFARCSCRSGWPCRWRR
ncbi:MAG: SWIM zinc finger family protein [Pontimonas sp.]|nr:SWIM zinc finger family protein [Pontimonas sp.]MCF8547468.1 SWIM zinc finger family protein [Pontimonas sp.]